MHMNWFDINNNFVNSLTLLRVTAYIFRGFGNILYSAVLLQRGAVAWNMLYVALTFLFIFNLCNTFYCIHKHK